MGEARPPTPSVAWAWRRLNETAGRLTIGALAEELGSSRRHLITRFHEEIGLAPKALARVLRFNRVVGLLERETPMPWAELAQDCGYYDQAHLNGDFREFAGTTPTDFLARRLPDGGGVVDG